QIDPLGRKVRIGYTDDFQPSQSFTTFAYPTTITDPAGTILGDALHSSTVKYRYDIGANVEANSPAPAGNTLGKKTTRLFDIYGRLQQETIVNSGAYTRYEYPTNGIQSKVFSTIIDTNANGADALDEVMSESWSDGAGRVRRSRTEHPGSSGGWSGSVVEYDILGRAKRQSVPTEISVPNANDPDTWAPAGDDATRGFLWTYQKYDWKGRVTRKINTDGTDSPVLNDSDVLITYEGCGCAGGQVTTIQSERVHVPDQGTTHARRTEKIYADILGRDFKTETFGWDGYSLYSTVTSAFNGRDQTISVTETEQSTSIGQITAMTYDGHGRLKTQHRPEQNSGTATTYNYNPDDSISSVTDARGATVTYGYGTQKLPVFVQYSVPQGSSVEVPSNVVFTYDALGNRTQMTDALGTVNYGYDELSRLVSESRQFSSQGTGFPNETATLNYTYTLSNKLRSYAMPFFSNLQVKYDFDKTGRLNVVSGTSSSATFDYADNPHYRAWGALTHLDYGNGTEMNVGGFNNKLQATTLSISKGTAQVINKTYEFNNDATVKKETDNLNPKFDRSYEYDHRSRMSKAMSGAEARGATDNPYNIPYRTNYQYDALGHQKQIEYRHYAQGPAITTTTYQNNRIVGGNYDNEGNLVVDTMLSAKFYEYNAAGKLAHSDYEISNGVDPYLRQQEYLAYDGDGYLGKITASVQEGETGPVNSDTTYRIRSSVLGGEVVYENGNAYVHANGTRIATQDNTGVRWNHKDPNLKSFRSTGPNGSVLGSGTSDLDWDHVETDADGKSVGFIDPGISFPAPFNDLFQSQNPFGSIVNGQFTSYSVDGILVPKDYFAAMLDFAFGSQFGVVERQARLSAPRFSHYSVRDRFGIDNVYSGTSWSDASDAAFRSENLTVTRNWVVSDQSWAVNLSLLPQTDASVPGGPQQQNWNPRFITHLDTFPETLLAQRIIDIAYFARDSKECAEAFRSVGAVPIGEQIANTTIVTQNVFGDPRHDSSWAPDDGGEFAKSLRDKLAAKTGYFGTVSTSDISQTGTYFGRRFIGLTNTGIKESNFKLSTTIIHSFLHSGGVPLYEGYFNYSPNDLDISNEKHAEIIEKCRKSNQ
ncbi:MAG: hypothetical protein WBD27_09915, partial [Pyrinomonadaceae bacterium]